MPFQINATVEELTRHIEILRNESDRYTISERRASAMAVLAIRPALSVEENSASG